MSNKNFEVVIDIGSSKIRAAAFHKNDKSRNFFCEGMFYSKDTYIENEIQKIISRIEKNTSEYLDNTTLMIDNESVTTINLGMSKNFDGLKLKREDIEFLIQDAKQQVTRNHPDKNIIHIIIKNYNINEIDYDFLPNDIGCNMVYIDIIFICISKNYIEKLKKIFFNSDVSVSQIYCTSYLKSQNYKENFSSNKHISFIDMGFNKTSITCFNNKKISFFHVIPVGGNHITKDLSKVLNVDLETAEKVKLNFDKDENILYKNNLSLKLTQQIIFARIEEILEICSKNIISIERLEKSIKFKMILMGEGSKILDNKFKDEISFSHEIDLLEETTQEICESALKLSESMNKQEVVIVPKKRLKEGFFEKLFHFFR